MNGVELAWAAGFYDGEGSTCLMKNRIQMGVGQSNDDGVPYTLTRFRIALGGIGSIFGPYFQGKRCKPFYYYKIQNIKEVQIAVNLLWPYLSPVKREQIRRVYNELSLDIPGEPTRQERLLKELELNEVG